MPFLAISELFFSFGKIIKGERKKKQVCINPLCMFERFFFLLLFFDEWKLKCEYGQKVPVGRAEFLQAVGSLLLIAPGTAIPTGLVIKNPNSDIFLRRGRGGEEATHNNYDLASPVFIDFLNADEWKCASLIKTHKMCFFFRTCFFFPSVLASL